MENVKMGLENIHDSPIFDIMKTALIFDMLDDVMHMLHGTRVFDKSTWKRKVWSTAWENEEFDWRLRTTFFSSTINLKQVAGPLNYLIWWKLSDLKPELMRQCEDMAKLVCNTSYLKSNDPRLKGSQPTEKMCVLCDEYALEDVKHVALQCTFTDELRKEMFLKISEMPGGVGNTLLEHSENILFTLLGKWCSDVDDHANLAFNEITSTYISRMYRITIKDRPGIG